MVMVESILKQHCGKPTLSAGSMWCGNRRNSLDSCSLDRSSELTSKGLNLTIYLPSFNIRVLRLISLEIIIPK